VIPHEILVPVDLSVRPVSEAVHGDSFRRILGYR
jgi:hypothetical protein